MWLFAMGIPIHSACYKYTPAATFTQKYQHSRKTCCISVSDMI